MDVLGENSTISDCNNTFTKDQKNLVLLVMGGNGFLSSIMCLIAVSMVICMKLYKNFIYRLAMYQILSSLCVSAVQTSFITLVNYNGNIYYQIACKTISFLMEYLLWIKLLFTICLVFHFFCLAVCLKNLEKLEIGYVLFSILFPLLYSWIPFIHNSFGVVGAWCWIRSWKDDCANEKYLEGIIEQFALWYGPLFISLSLTIVAVFITLIVLAQRGYRHKNLEFEPLIENRERNKIWKAIKELLPLLVYPVIFYVLSLFPLIDRIHSAISPNVSFGWAFAHSITEPLYGFFSSWALIIHILVAQHIKKNKISSIKEAQGEATHPVPINAKTNHSGAGPVKSDTDNI